MIQQIIVSCIISHFSSDAGLFCLSRCHTQGAGRNTRRGGGEETKGRHSRGCVGP